LVAKWSLHTHFTHIHPLLITHILTLLSSSIIRKKSRRDSGEEHIATSKGSNLLSSELEELSGIYYRPRTRETRSAYEILLSFIQQAIGDQPRDILCGAADEVLATLKDEHLREREKQREISSLLGSVEDDKFALLVGLGKKITDYGAERHTTEEDEAIDESYGVAVVFHEEEEGGGGKGETTVAQDEGEEEGGDEEEGVEADYEGVLHADLTTEGLGSSSRSREKLEPRTVDAYWLQRELNKFFKDPIVSQKKADEVLEILKNASDNRDCENKLVLLLGYDQFQFIKVLFKNRWTVLYCTQLARTENEREREKIETEMKADPEKAAVLKALSELGSEDLVQEERTRKAAVRKSRMDADLDAESADLQEKKALGSRKILDLEDITFTEGSHFMANKRCQLPSGSFRQSKKGFEEVHVPALKPKPFEVKETLKPITNLPSWAQQAFSNYRSLNRIQSRLADTALHTDDNLLLCAPTGAGKTNVALLCILREINKHMNPDGTINLDEFKVIYVAPMRSLVQEMVANFSKVGADTQVPSQ